MDKFTIEVKGLKELNAKIDKLDDLIRKEAFGQLIRGAQLFVAAAQRDAPVDFGRLRQGISYKTLPEKGLAVELVSSAEYSPYLEWGTIEKFVPPHNSEELTYAANFRGRNIRKTGGVSPHPFFFKNVPVAVAAIEKGMNAILNDIKV